MRGGRVGRPAFALVAFAALALAACTSGGASDGSGDTGLQLAADFPTPSGASATGRDAVVEVVDRVLPAVVNVVSTTSEGAEGEGTGFVVRSDGVIVTNFHVVQGATQVQVLSSDDEPDRYDARVIGGDVAADVAILEIDAEDLPTVPLGDSGSLELGQQVVAVGYALGFAGGPSVTTGVVSSLTRRIPVSDPNCPREECPQGERVYSHLIQTDAAINRGNSGGPLVDLAGNVVGINTAGVGAASAENVAFAIQIDYARPYILEAAEHPNEPVPFLGVSSGDASDPALQLQLQIDPPVDRGALVLSVVPGEPADRAGIEVGDVIVSFDGTSIDGWESLGEAIRDHDPGDRVEVEVVHLDGARETVTVTLGLNPTALP